MIKLSVIKIFIRNVLSFNKQKNQAANNGLSICKHDSISFICLIYQANDGEPAIRVLVNGPVEIKDNYFSKPIGRTDLLKAPENFPLAECRYTLRELTVVWYIYGGSDLTDVDKVTVEKANTEINYR